VTPCRLRVCGTFPFQEAVEELEELPESLKELPTVLVVWLEVYQRWQKWSEARRQTVIRSGPEEPSWPVALAYATRRSRGLVLADEVLPQACEKFPHSTNFVTLVS
jgi:hypothetical protein